jgi:hypothetical protein
LSMRRCSGAPWVPKTLDDVEETVSRDRAVDLHGQGLTGELVDDVGDLQASIVSGLVELEVDGPDVVRVFGPVPDGRVRPEAAALGAALGSAQTLGGPEALGALLVEHPALTPEDLVSHLPAPPGVGLGQLAQATAELELLGTRGPGRAALGGSGLVDHPTGPAQRPRNARSGPPRPGGGAPG